MQFRRKVIIALRRNDLTSICVCRIRCDNEDDKCKRVSDLF